MLPCLQPPSLRLLLLLLLAGAAHTVSTVPLRGQRAPSGSHGMGWQGTPRSSTEVWESLPPSPASIISIGFSPEGLLPAK